MIPATLDIEIKQWGDWPWNIYVEEDDGTPVDLTDYIAYMHIRQTLEGPLEKELTTEGATPNIVITPSTGLIAVNMLAEETALLRFRQGVYDLHIYKDGTPPVHEVILEGDVTIRGSVVRGVTW